MSKRADQDRAPIDNVSQQPTEASVYVAPGSIFSGVSDDRISLRRIWQILWRGKATIIAATIVFSVSSVVYALLAKEIYRAEVLLAPAEHQSMPAIGGQLGGLAALAGVGLGDGNNVEALAVLRSRDFARQFIDDKNLVPGFFEDDWDAENGRWREQDVTRVPDVRDGVRYFHAEVLDVAEDRSSGLVTLAIEWTDADTAANWAGTLARRLNDRLRERALFEAQANVTYLQSEMVKSNLVMMQQSIGQLLQTELQKLMLARGNEEFAFKVVDPAVAPRRRERPKRALLAIAGTLLGGLLGVFLVLLTHAWRAGEDA